MRLSRDLVGVSLGPAEVTWEPTDCNLYALGVGAGQVDPLRELRFTTDRDQAVYPTFLVVLAGGVGIKAPLDLLGDAVDVATMLHVGQSCELHTPLPAAGSASVSGRVSALWDKGSATILETTVEVTDQATGVLYGRSVSTLFFRGVGGWGGDRGPTGQDLPLPTNQPDQTFTIQTRPDQALLYRLSGDHNPLHVDPDFARQAGFDRPILHGLCVYGVVGRELLSRYGSSEPGSFVALQGRFSQSSFPGDRLTVRCWEHNATVRFAVINERQQAVVDQGQFRTHND